LLALAYPALKNPTTQNASTPHIQTRTENKKVRQPNSAQDDDRGFWVEAASNEHAA
jgi:hypothetical protein